MARVLIHDGLNPEDTAMLQALYSRSAASVTSHLDKVKASGSGKFMERFYIGYGHKSIGDCGSTTIFVEGLSELAAKAIQDWPLYSGQQTSTRYIDFAAQPLCDPLATAASKKILERWMAFYTGNIDAVREDLRARFARGDADEGDYERALKARSFDVMRAFLPAGITTQLSWHTNLRQAGDKLALLRHHPLDEVRELAGRIEAELAAAYPHSFSGKIYEEQEAWRETLLREFNYSDADWPPVLMTGGNAAAGHGLMPGGCVSCDWKRLAAATGHGAAGEHVAVDAGENEPFFVSSARFDAGELATYRDLLRTRPVKTDLPFFLDAAGQIRARFVIDYGSFRDIQRHRHGATRMPLVTTRHGFEPWYLSQLPADVRDAAESLLAEQAAAIAVLDCAPETKQYYTALGYRVVCDYAWGLPAAVYVAEIRSGATVHPTLRRIAHALSDALEAAVPGMVLYIDRSKDGFSAARGKQDIREKE